MIKIDGYPIDLTLSEEFSADSDVSKYAIEQGAKRSDHIENQPEQLTMEGIVSDTPIGEIAGDPTRQGLIDGATPSSDAFSRLRAIRARREPVLIECSLGRFEDMALVSLRVPKSKETGKALQFTVVFEKMNFVTNNRTTVRVAIPNGGGRDNLGNKESKEWGKNFKLPGRVFVVSWPVNFRTTLIKSLGKPFLTTTHVDRLASNGVDDDARELDHYQIRGDTKPDGYCDAFFGKTDQGEGLFPAGKQVYHRFKVTATVTRFKGQTEDLKHELNGRNVHYDYQEKAWVDDENGQIVRRHQTRPGEPGHMDEKWRGVTYGSNLPGGGIEHAD